RDVSHDLLVVLQERRGTATIVDHLTFNQAVADKDVARLYRVDATEIHPASFRQRLSEQPDAHARRRLATTLAPVRLVILIRKQVGRGTFQPLRLDDSDRVRIQTAGFDQLAGD